MLDEAQRQRIEKDCLNSWDEVQAMYDELQQTKAKRWGAAFDWALMCQLIQAMREEAYDLCFLLDGLEGCLLFYPANRIKGLALCLTACDSKTMDIYAKVRNKEYRLLSQPMVISHELKSLLDLLLAQAIE